MAFFQNPKKKAVLVKYDGTPTSADAIKMCEPVQFKPNLRKNSCDAVGDGIGEKKETIVDSTASTQATIGVKARTSANAGELPHINNLYKIAGLQVAIDDDANTVTYTKAPTMEAKGTIIDYTDGEKRVITKMLSDMTIEFEKGKVVSLQFPISGEMDVIPVNEANPTDIVLDTNSQFVVDKLTTRSFDGGSLQFKKATFKLGNDISESAVMGEAYRVGKRLPTITIEDDKEVGNIQHWVDIVNQTNRAFSIETVATNGQKMKLEITKMSYENPEESFDDSRVGLSREFNVHEFSIIYS